MSIQLINDLREVVQGSRETVYLVNDDDIYLALSEEKRLNVCGVPRSVFR